MFKGRITEELLYILLYVYLFFIGFLLTHIYIKKSVFQKEFANKYCEIKLFQLFPLKKSVK